MLSLVAMAPLTAIVFTATNTITITENGTPTVANACGALNPLY